MPFFKIAILFAACLAVFLVIDIIWLGVIAKDFYRKQLGSLMSPNVNWAAAILFYCIYIGGIMFFVIFPSIERSSFTYALATGAALGLLCYATYDLTNLATLKGWPPKMVVIDIIWGMVLTAIVGGAGYLIGSLLQGD